LTGPAGRSDACLIGITAATERARWAAWDQFADLAPAGYASCVQAAGAVAVLLPTDRAVTESPESLLDRLDGLILTGGVDVDPASYGAEAAPETSDVRPDRDRFELSLAKAALESDLPLLGICRGFQLMNISAGGNLDQHLPDRLGHEGHRTVPGSFDEHEVELSEGSMIAGLCGRNRLVVSSHHHQGLDRIGEGLRVTGVAVPDGIVEAIEVEGRDFAIGVQWHPEIEEGDRLIPALVEAARERMER